MMPVEIQWRSVDLGNFSKAEQGEMKEGIEDFTEGCSKEKR